MSLFCDSEKLKAELDNLNWDKKALMYGRVVNKNARHNLCFADVSQEADYKSGKGTVIPFDSVPCLATVRGRLSEFLGASGENLFAEGNYYFDLKNCGIGFHGDSERRKVVAMRVGASNPIVFQWFFKNNPVGIPIRIDLNDGDMYIMSDKAVGNDWKKSSIYTLRHAAGAEKFLKYKPKKALQKKKQHEQHVDMRDEPSLKRTKIETTDLLKN